MSYPSCAQSKTVLVWGRERKGGQGNPGVSCCNPQILMWKHGGLSPWLPKPLAGWSCSLLLSGPSSFLLPSPGFQATPCSSGALWGCYLWL